MAKKILAIFLTICLLVLALPVTASAQSSQHNALVRQINRCYYNTCSALDVTSLDNMCGNFVGYQLYYLGITDSVRTCNGSQFYDVYSQLEVTSGGYNIKCYSAGKYTLEQALNTITRNGTKNAYNVMLCFDWTKTGGSFGHVMLIHAIIDGVVYAVDNFETAIAGSEGRPIVAPIARFVKEYEGWSMFEGAVDFGNQEFAYHCPSYATDMFIRATEDAALLSQPAPEGSNGSEIVRMVVPGERLAVTSLVVGESKVNYYCVREGGKNYYIPGSVSQPILLNTEGLDAREISFEAAQQVGDPGVFTGKLYSTGGLISKVELQVADGNGKVLWRGVHNDARPDHDLADLKVDFSGLAEGAYSVKLYATLWNYYDDNGMVNRQNQRLLVLEDTLLVGDVQPQERAADSGNTTVKHNWIYEDSTWRCYRNGEPRTGWYCYDGVDYYLKEDGSVTTGWANINGEDRFFSETGAMRTGWLVEADGDVRYMLFNGVSAKGWREIDGETYYFDDNGILDTDKIPEE